MGLDTTHGCWEGAYSAFGRWRSKLAEVAGFPPLYEMPGYKSYGAENHNVHSWEPYKDDPLTVLLTHSDCDGSIAAAQCGPLADRLEQLLPLLPSEPDNGHIGIWKDKTQQFIDGLRLAASRGEDVEFK